MFHGEPVLRDGRPLGYIRAASYGHTLGGAVGLAMIAADEAIDGKWIEAECWEVEIAGTRYPAIASLRPLYDPEKARIVRNGHGWFDDCACAPVTLYGTRAP